MYSDHNMSDSLRGDHDQPNVHVFMNKREYYEYYGSCRIMSLSFICAVPIMSLNLYMMRYHIVFIMNTALFTSSPDKTLLDVKSRQESIGMV